MSTETKIDLQQFCARGDIRAYLAQPFVIDGHTYASNGHIIVRVPGGGADTELPGSLAANVRKIFSTEHTDFVTLPTIPERGDCESCNGTGRSQEVSCHECGGDGTFTRGKHWYECQECDGSGRIGGDQCRKCNGDGEGFLVIQIGAAHFQARYLRMIAALPNAHMSAPAKDGPAAFVFDGGEGRLMPCWPE